MEPLTGEVLNIKNEYGSYQEYKAAVDTELQRSAESFVRIGYLLKVARDTDILSGSGYGSVNEFAEAEYNLDKSQVSRFIRINDEYSEGGYSDRLQEKYRSFGYAKLALMLTLPAAVGEELTADYTKSEIQTIKNEIDEEKQRTDIEVMLEEKDERQQEYSLFTKVLHQMLASDPQMYRKLHEAVANTVYDGTSGPVIARMTEALAPAGEAVHSVRIAGEGKKLLIIKGADKDPVLFDVRSGDKTACTWDDFITDMETLCVDGDPKESWEILYGEAFPEEKKEVAPVQPDKSAKQSQKKPQRVHVSNPETPEKTRQHTDKAEQMGEKNEHEDVDREKEQDSADRGQAGRDDNAAEYTDNAPGTGRDDRTRTAGMEDDTDSKAALQAAGAVTDLPAAVVSDTVEGQMDIQQFPQWMPEKTTAEGQKKQHDLTRGYIEALQDLLEKIYSLTIERDYEAAEARLEAVRGTIRKIRDVEEMA